ncbi:MAG: DUF6600 domain-containing protein [Verrucomicrobiota bacterium]
MNLILTVVIINLATLPPFGVKPDVDFDIAYEALEFNGQWHKMDEAKYCYIPTKSIDNPQWRPYREGQWIYTDYGWTWKGVEAIGWATDHYGHWGRHEDKWAWFPSPVWLPSKVEWMSSGVYIGWRASVLDRFGNPTEPENVRYSKPNEWNFILKEKLTQPLKLSDFASDEEVAKILPRAIPLDHIFQTYREIGRPGPLPSIGSGSEIDPPVITGIPHAYYKESKLKPNAFYMYRPKFRQDDEGIMKRIELRLNPPELPDEATLRTLVPEATEEEKAEMNELMRKERKYNERRENSREAIYVGD